MTLTLTHLVKMTGKKAILLALRMWLLTQVLLTSQPLVALLLRWLRDVVSRLLRTRQKQSRPQPWPKRSSSFRPRILSLKNKSSQHLHHSRLGANVKLLPLRLLHLSQTQQQILQQSQWVFHTCALELHLPWFNIYNYVVSQLSFCQT